MTVPIYFNKLGIGSKKLVPFLLLTAAVALYLSRGRTCWPYLASSYGIGVFAYYWERRYRVAADRGPLLEYLFPKQVWLHPSAINDFGMSLISFAAFLPTLYWSYTWQAGRFLADSFASMSHLASMRQYMPPSMTVSIIFTITAVLFSDFFYYIFHRLQHTVPMLWEFHKIHHSAEVMTPITLHRRHPVDSWLEFAFHQTGYLIASCVFFYFYPNLKGLYMVGKLNIALVFLYAIGTNLQHSHIWVRYGRLIEHILISPAQHQTHHSVDAKHFNRNFGAMFSLWDWAFGSLYIPQGREMITFGLPDTQMHESYHSVSGLCLQPFKQFLKKPLPLRIEPYMAPSSVPAHKEN